MSDSSNPDEAHENLRKDNTTVKTELKKEIYQRLGEFSTLDGATILQIDATLIVGVLFFLTLTSLLRTEEMPGGFIAVFLTISLVFPFSVSAILVLLAYGTQLYRTWIHFTKEKPMRPMHEKDYRTIARISQYAFVLTMLGFFYILLVLGDIAYDTWNARNTQTEAQQCGEDPERFGINETDNWKCSMFNRDTLAGQCASNPSQFNKSLSECHEFIPPSDLLGQT